MQDGTGFAPSIRGRLLEQVAPGVMRLDMALVNAYLVGTPGGPWALVDTGLPFRRRSPAGRPRSSTEKESGPRLSS